MPDDVRQTSTHFRLRELVELAVTGRIRPAAFSRPPAWRPNQVVDLFDSIAHGYPIGTLIAVEEPAPEEEVAFGDISIDAPREERALIIVDGLQRITALVGALTGMRGMNKGKRHDIFYDLEDAKVATGPLVRDSMLPVRVAANGSDLAAWIRGHPFLSEREVDACWRLSRILNEYMIPIIILAGSDVRNTAPNVFTRINTSGASLTKSDVARAQSSRFDTVDLGLDRLQAEVERTGFGRMSIGLAAECALAVAEEAVNIADDATSTRQKSRQMFQRLPLSLQRDAVDRARKIIIPTVQFLIQETAIPHISLLPRSVMLPTLMRFVSAYGPPTGRAGELMRRWVWRSGTVSSTNRRLIFPAALDSQKTALGMATDFLDSLPSYPGPHWRPDTSALRFSRINGRLNTLALLSLRPRLLVPADDDAEQADMPISVMHNFAIWLDGASSALSPLLPHSFLQSRHVSFASYLLHPPVKQARLLEAIVAMTSEDADLLAGHCIDRNALGFLQRGDFEEFVEYRQRQMFEAILRRVQSMARWGFRDHGGLPDIRDDPRYTDEYSDE